jgi:hypothetical protein
VIPYEFDPLGHVHRIGGLVVPGHTDVLRGAGFQYPSDRMGNSADVQLAMDRGKAVHLATEFDDRGELDERSVDDWMLGYLLAWRKFREETGFKPRRIEEAHGNAELMFGAVLDREGTWKLSKGGVLVEVKKYDPPFFTGIQLCLQDLTLPRLAKPRARAAVRLDADGKYKITHYEDRSEAALASALASLWWYKKNNAAR